MLLFGTRATLELAHLLLLLCKHHGRRGGGVHRCHLAVGLLVAEDRQRVIALGVGESVT